MMRIARWLAVLGGIVLLLLVVITCLSITGRTANTIGHSSLVVQHLPALAGFLRHFGPINGDFELVEAGIAIAIFAFFPWCTMVRGHATVDIFTTALPAAANRAIELLWEFVFFLIYGVIAWRLFVGMSDKIQNGETTLLLQFPLWWGYAVCGVLAVFGTLIAGYMVTVRFAELGGRRILPSQHGSIDH
jgi:TRAP-type C4-dicarboxylate transport system permease small subunit